MVAFHKKRKLSKKESKALKKKEALDVIEREKSSSNSVGAMDGTSKSQKTSTITLPRIITVRDLAVRFDMSVVDLIAELMKNGITATINESIDFDSAAIIADELGYKVKSQTEESRKVEKKDSKKENLKSKILNLKSRPPVVVVMGHVDHGKTTLLDYIRKTKVAAGESGGITQHIGAYQVEIAKRKTQSVKQDNKNKEEKSKSKSKSKSKKLQVKSQPPHAASHEQIVTFLDTPGHEAFSAMRAHGANITDVAILVVAAEDGVKPQTKEAISHAKAANIPIIVAINKIDKSEANVEKTKRELGDLGLVSEEWGGDTVMVPISAKTGKGVEKLLEMLAVVVELEELKADPQIAAQGVIIESHMQKGLGSVATVLVQQGTIKQSDAIIVSDTFGKIKRMEDYLGNIIKEATPSMPVKITGLKNIAIFGERLQVVENEKVAREKAQDNQGKAKRTHLSLGEISQKIKSGQIKEFNIVLKTDTQGSLEAIKDALSNLSNQEAVIKVIHDGIGDISESDINLAISSKALVVGFHVNVSESARRLAEAHKIKINLYDIIYNLIDDLTSGLSGLLEPEIIEESLGKLIVLKIFKDKKEHKIIGGKVTSDKMIKGAKVKIKHEKNVIGKGTIDTLEQNKKAMPSVDEGFECGLGIKTQTKIEEGDTIEAFTTKEIARKIG